MHRADVRTHLQLSCISTPPYAERYELGGHVVHVRDRGLCELNDEFVKRVQAKEYKASEFGEFLRKKREMAEKLG